MVTWVWLNMQPSYRRISCLFNSRVVLTFNIYYITKSSNNVSSLNVMIFALQSWVSYFCIYLIIFALLKYPLAVPTIWSWHFLKRKRTTLSRISSASFDIWSRYLQTTSCKGNIFCPICTARDGYRVHWFQKLKYIRILGLYS